MRIKAWNRGAEDLWGVRREEAEGTTCLNGGSNGALLMVEETKNEPG